LISSDRFRFSLVSFVYDQRIHRCRYPQIEITHYVLTLRIAFTCLRFPVYRSARRILKACCYCVPMARSQILTHSTFPCNQRLSITVRNSKISKHQCSLQANPFSADQPRSAARAHVSRKLAASGRFTLRTHTRVSDLPDKPCISTASTTPSHEQPARGSPRLSFTPKRAVTSPRTDIKSSSLLFCCSLHFSNAILRAQPYVELATAILLFRVPSRAAARVGTGICTV
jgi:hypothetical protein